LYGAWFDEVGGLFSGVIHSPLLANCLKQVTDFFCWSMFPEATHRFLPAWNPGDSRTDSLLRKSHASEFSIFLVARPLLSVRSGLCKDLAAPLEDMHAAAKGGRNDWFATLWRGARQAFLSGIS
jgi:hypothetical protein